FYQDKKQYRAKVVGKEPKKDMAVLKLQEMPKKLHPITVGSSKNLQAGQKTIAIGSPFGLNNTITQGIVSALNRKIDGIGGVKIHGMIQTDAAINPGNSGGPLLNSQGHLIGMNTLIYSKSGSSAGVGFAVPVDTIKRIVPQLIKHGRIIRPVLGVLIFDQRYFNMEKGIVIKSTLSGGPAQKAGLKGTRRDRYGRLKLGDIILKIDNKKVNKLDDIYHVLEKYKVGDTVQVTFLRDKKIQKVKLKVGSN
ncbi:MAG: trypsin-like peptidase domain-containing protein, partial [Halobacteriovoraceae bacterium]|nr:trypsin-like peptidase domain-containing protein [Halobacteriovoraceae bacterium]